LQKTGAVILGISGDTPDQQKKFHEMERKRMEKRKQKETVDD